MDWIGSTLTRLGSVLDSSVPEVDPIWTGLDRYGSVGIRLGFVWVRYGSDLDCIGSIGFGRDPIWIRIGPDVGPTRV